MRLNHATTMMRDIAGNRQSLVSQSVSQKHIYIVPCVVGKSEAP